MHFVVTGVSIHFCQMQNIRHRFCPSQRQKPPVRRCVVVSAAANATASSLPGRCRKLVAASAGESLADVATVVDVPCPTPAPDEVLIRVTHAGINGGCETFRCRAEYTFARNRDIQGFDLGAEGCGVVMAVGDLVSSLKVGTAVAFNGAAAFSEYVSVKPRLCTVIPRPSAEAVAVTLSGVTACVALEETAKIQRGDTVLVTAASGGTGHFAVQLANLCGCHVIATCGGGHKEEALAALGADRVINYQKEDVAEVLSREYPGGVDVVYEGVGGRLRQIALMNLAEGGRLLQVGYISEYPHTTHTAPQPHAVDGVSIQDVTSTQPPPSLSPATHSGDIPVTGCSSSSTPPFSAGSGHPLSDIPPPSELFWQNKEVQWGSKRVIGAIWPKDPRAVARARKRMFSLFLEGGIRVWVDESKRFHGVESIPEAVEHMLRGQHVGKVVVSL